MNKVNYSRHILKRFLSSKSTAQPLMPVKPKSVRPHPKRFVDYKKVCVVGGNGGNGMMSFLSIKFNAWAGPDGGNGGNGGHVIFIADKDVHSLGHLRSIMKGKDGARGQSKNCHGANAEHRYIKVPLGTIISDETGILLADLAKESDVFVGARGGAGGRGNSYYVSSENTAPTTYEEGGGGEERVLQTELRVMAHVGLVGFPNAGKSTLLRAISRARPKVAAYPFTTLNPHVGIVLYDDLEQMAVADIPGLVKGAHENYGLGFSFLRHIERCSCLLYVIDLAQEKPWTQIHDLKYELEQYKEGLSQRPHAVVANKIDKDIAKENLPKFMEMVSDLEVIPVSAMLHKNIDNLLLHLRQMYDKHVIDSNS